MNSRRFAPLALLLAALVPSMASALSCAPPPAGVVLDSLLEQGKTPKLIVAKALLGDAAAPEYQDAKVYDFSGFDLFGARFEGDDTEKQVFRVILHRNCAGAWCGSGPRPGRRVLVMLEETNGRLAGHVGPCSGSLYALPTPQQASALRRCLIARPCDPDLSAVPSLARPSH